MACPAIMLVAGLQESFYVSPNSCEVAIVRLPNPAYVPDRCQTIEEPRVREAHVLEAISENSPAMGGIQNDASSRAERYAYREDLKRRLPSHVHLAQVNTVEKRNARERTRVDTVNQAFLYLKKILPPLRANTKRVSKLKILRAAINYIRSLDKDAEVGASSVPNNSSVDVLEVTQSMFAFQHAGMDNSPTILVDPDNLQRPSLTHADQSIS